MHERRLQVDNNKLEFVRKWISNGNPSTKNNTIKRVNKIIEDDAGSAGVVTPGVALLRELVQIIRSWADAMYVNKAVFFAITVLLVEVRATGDKIPLGEFVVEVS